MTPQLPPPAGSGPLGFKIEEPITGQDITPKQTPGAIVPKPCLRCRDMLQPKCERCKMCKPCCWCR